MTSKLDTFEVVEIPAIEAHVKTRVKQDTFVLDSLLNSAEESVKSLRELGASTKWFIPTCRGSHNRRSDSSRPQRLRYCHFLPLAYPECLIQRPTKWCSQWGTLWGTQC